MKLFSYTLMTLSCVAGICHAENSAMMNRDAGAQEKICSVRGFPEAPCVRALLCSNQPSLEIAVSGSHNVYNPKNGKKLEASFLFSSYSMTPSNDGLKWGEEFPGIYQVMIVPDSTSTFITVNGIQYPGVVICYQVGDRLAAVNYVTLDDFSSSVLCHSLLPSLQDTKESIAAYSIAFRTKGLSYIQNPRNTFWDVQATSCNYRGRGIVRQDRPYQDGIKITKRLVLVGKDMGPLSAQDETLAELIATMSQDEVNKMAHNGKNAKEILEQFFPDAILTVAPKSTDSTQTYLNS